MSGGEWAQILAAAFTAVTAAAAWAAVRVSLRLQREALKPNLSAGLLHAMPSGKLSLSIANGGPGLAVQVMYMIVVGGQKAQGVIGDGHLIAGEKRVEDLPIPPGSVRFEESASLVWSCRDVDFNVHAWSEEWTYRRTPRKLWLRRSEVTILDVFRDFYPDVLIP